MKIIVTGARGMLGRQLTPYLRAKKLEVIEWDVPEMDITKRKIILQGIKSERPDCLIHLAAFTDVDQGEMKKEKTYEINFRGTLNLVFGAKEIGCKFLYLSTDYVFDGKKGSPYSEDDAPNPINYYGWTKYLGERAIAQELKRYFIVRTAWLYSREGKNFVNQLKEKIEKGEELRVVDDQIGSPTYTKDLCEPISNLISSEHFGIYHLINSGAASWFQLAKEIVKILGIKKEVHPITTEELKRPAPRPKFSVLANNRYKKIFGKELRHWREALAECLSNY